MTSSRTGIFLFDYISMVDEALCWQYHIIIFIQFPKRIISHFEQMPVEVIEVAVVATPESFLCRFDYRCTELLHLVQHFVHFAFGFCIIRNGDAGEAATFIVNGCIFSQQFSRIKPQYNATEGKQCKVVEACRRFFPSKPLLIKRK